MMLKVGSLKLKALNDDHSGLLVFINEIIDYFIKTNNVLPIT